MPSIIQHKKMNPVSFTCISAKFLSCGSVDDTWGFSGRSFCKRKHVTLRKYLLTYVWQWQRQTMRNALGKFVKTCTGLTKSKIYFISNIYNIPAHFPCQHSDQNSVPDVYWTENPSRSCARCEAQMERPRYIFSLAQMRPVFLLLSLLWTPWNS